MLDTWLRAVFRLMPMRSATSWLVSPWATSAEDLQFAVGELGEGAWLGGRRSRCQVLDQAFGHRRAKQRLAVGHGPNRAQQGLLMRVLEQVAPCPRPHGGQDRIRVLEHRQHEHADLRLRGQDPACGLDPVDPRQLQVHQDDVRSDLRGLGDDLVAVAGFADDFQVGRRRQQGAHALPEEVVIVSQQDADPLLRHRV